MKEIVSLRELKGDLERVLDLSYPARIRDYASKVVEELEKLGLDGLYLDKKSGGLLRIGKGYRGVVFKGVMGDDVVAVKVLRTDSSIKDLSREAEHTRFANNHGIGARLKGADKCVIIFDYIDGPDLDVWLRALSPRMKKELRTVLRRCLRKARTLDTIGLDHGELGDARRHILVKRDLNPVIIDFGKASMRRRPRNVTSLFSYLTYGPHSEKILRMLSLTSPPIELSRTYKRRMDEESFNKLLEALHLL